MSTLKRFMLALCGTLAYGSIAIAADSPHLGKPISEWFN